MSMTDIITMKSTDLDFLLSNHELFTPNEVKLAAKMKVKQDKEPKYNMNSGRGDSDLSRYAAHANMNNPLGYCGQAPTVVFGDLFGIGV